MENISGMVEVMERGVADEPAVEGFESFEVCGESYPCEDPDLADFCALTFVKIEVDDAPSAAASSEKRTSKKNRRKTSS